MHVLAENHCDQTRDVNPRGSHLHKQYVYSVHDSLCTLQTVKKEEERCKKRLHQYTAFCSPNRCKQNAAVQ